MSVLGRRIKGRSHILPLLLIGLMFGSALYYFNYFPFTSYPTGYEVGAKIDSARVNGAIYPSAHSTYPDGDNKLTGSYYQYDPDVKDYGSPDIKVTIGQPEHGTYIGGVFSPTDDSKYTQTITRDFWNPERNQVERHVYDLHYYRFTVIMRTVADINTGVSDGIWRVEALWDHWTNCDQYESSKTQQDELNAWAIFSFTAKPWDYSVNPTVGELSEYSVESSQTWVGILGTRVINTETYLFNSDNDPAVKYPKGSNQDGWTHGGRATVRALTDVNTYLANIGVFNANFGANGRPNLPQEVTKMEVGMGGFVGLSIYWNDRDWPRSNIVEDKWLQNIGVKYEIMSEVIMDHSFVLVAPEDTGQQPGEENQTETEDEPRKGTWDNIENWGKNRWGEVKGIGGFIGGIIGGIFDLVKVIILVIILIIAIVLILIVFSFVRAMFSEGKRKKRRVA